MKWEGIIAKPQCRNKAKKTPHFSIFSFLRFSLVIFSFSVLDFRFEFSLSSQGVLATGVMAVNAIIYGNPYGAVSGDQHGVQISKTKLFVFQKKLSF